MTVTLIQREFVVNASLDVVWRHLAKVEQWPTWAQHIKHIELEPRGELSSHSSGAIHLKNGLRSTFRMTEFNPSKNWKWVGPFLWLTIHYDHCFERSGNEQTKVRFVVAASGFGVTIFGPLFAALYSRNLDRAIPVLIQQLETHGSRLGHC